MVEKLLKAVNIFHGALSDTSKIAELTEALATDVVLHQDGLALDHDVKGAETVLRYFQTYYEQEFSAHKLIAVGADVDQDFGFAFWIDEGATAQQEAKARAESGGAPQHFLTRHTHSQSSVGIAAYKFGTGEHRTITDIYQMRQLTAAESANVLKDPSKAAPPLDISTLQASDGALDSQAVLRAAQTYSSTWQSGDVDALDGIVTESFEEFDVILADKPSDLQQTKKMITGTVREWQYLDNIGSEAVAAPDNTRCFIFWSATGKIIGEQGAPKQSLYGLNFLLFNSSGKIQKIASFRQPLPSERQKIPK